LGGFALRGPRPAETDVSEGNGAPDKECGDAAEIDNVGIGFASAGADVHHGEAAKEVGEDYGGDRHAAAVCLAEESGRHLLLRHEEDGARANVDGAIGGGEHGDEDEGVDKVDSAFPAGSLDGDSHWAFQGAAGAVGQVVGVGGAREAEKECNAHVDEQDSPDDLSDGQWDGNGWISRLGGCNRHCFNASVKGRCKNEDGCHTAEAIGPGPRIMPVSKSKCLLLSHQAPRRVNNGKHKVGAKPQKLDQRQPELGFTKRLDPQHLEAQESKPEDEEIAPERDLVAPEEQKRRNDVVLVGEHACPDQPVLPAHRHGKSLVDKAVGQRDECAARGIQGRHFSQGLRDAECNDANDTKANEQRRRPAVGQRAAGSHEDAGPDDARERHHRKMPCLEAALDTAGVHPGAIFILAGARYGRGGLRRRVFGAGERHDERMGLAVQRGETWLPSIWSVFAMLTWR